MNGAPTSDVRWVLGAIVVVTILGVGGLVAALVLGVADAAMLAVIAGLVTTTLASLGAYLRGEKNTPTLNRIDHAVNGKLQQRLDAQDAALAEISARLDVLGK